MTPQAIHINSTQRLLHLIMAVATIAIGMSISSCQNEMVSDDPTLRLSFSEDTVRFDTIFTGVGTSTQKIIVHNTNRNALRINRIWTDSAQHYFKINIDGETDLSRLSGFELRGGDSIYIFIRSLIDLQNQNNPVLIEDAINFEVNSHVDRIRLEAYGQDVHLIKSQNLRSEWEQMRFRNDKPYLIYDTMVVGGKTVFEPGARLYMHQGASLTTWGNVEVMGTTESPVVVMGDRRDYLFGMRQVPYSYAAGQWDGIYLMQNEEGSINSYQINHLEVISANVGLYCASLRKDNIRPIYHINGCRIHNHAAYGIVVSSANSDIFNTEVSNAAGYCVYLSGGNHRIIHTTIASYFNSTDVHIQSHPREDMAALYIDNLDKNAGNTVVDVWNSIVTGVRDNQVVVATPFPQYYTGKMFGNYLKCDTLQIPQAFDNVYASENDTVFVNTYFKYDKFEYYNFQLDSLSPACMIADPDVTQQFDHDRLGRERDLEKPDAGCYARP